MVRVEGENPASGRGSSLATLLSRSPKPTRLPGALRGELWIVTCYGSYGNPAAGFPQLPQHLENPAAGFPTRPTAPTTIYLSEGDISNELEKGTLLMRLDRVSKCGPRALYRVSCRIASIDGTSSSRM